jgi:hypothetical protein
MSAEPQKPELFDADDGDDPVDILTDKTKQPQDKGGVDWLTGRKTEEPKNVKPDEKGQKKEPDDDHPKKKKTKAEQVGDLRKSRDDAVNRAKELEEELNSLKGKGAADIDKYNDVYKYIKEKYDNNPESYINANKKRKKELEAAQKKLGEANTRLREIDITQSQEWASEILTPIKRAQDDIYVAVAGNFIKKGDKGEISVSHRTIFDGFIDQIISTNGPKNAIELKAVIKEFAEFFNRQTGEDFEVAGTTREIVSALEEINEKRTKAKDLYDNWEQEKNKIKVKTTEEQQDFLQKQRKQTLEAFKAGTKKAYDEFDVDLLDGLYESNEVRDIFLSAYTESAKAIEEPSDAPPWEEVITLSAKGRMFDKLLDEFKKTKEELSEFRDADFDGVPGSRRQPVARHSNGEIDWLTGKPNPK